jgi:hypothetical protein
MAYFGTGNNLISGGNGAGTALYVLKEALLAAGWELVLNSTGASGFTPTSADQLTTPALFGAANAWSRLREPAIPVLFARREYVLQNGTANGTTGIIKYSRATGFTTPGANGSIAPTTGGGDGQVLVGTGTDAAPVAALLANSTGYVAAVASDTPSAGTYGGYAWYLLGYTVAPVANVRVVLTEPVAPGSTSSLDQDPTWRFGTGAGATVNSFQLTPSWMGGAWYTNQILGIQYWQAYGIPAAPPSYIRGGQCAFTALRTPTLNTWTYQTANFVQASPYDGREPMYPLLVGQASVSSSGIPAAIPKGYTTGLATFAATHNLLDTFNLNTADPKIAVYLTADGLVSLALPWLTNIVPAV